RRPCSRDTSPLAGVTAGQLRPSRVLSRTTNRPPGGPHAPHDHRAAPLPGSVQGRNGEGAALLALPRQARRLLPLPYRPAHGRPRPVDARRRLRRHRRRPRHRDRGRPRLRGARPLRVPRRRAARAPRPDPRRLMIRVAYPVPPGLTLDQHSAVAQRALAEFLRACAQEGLTVTSRPRLRLVRQQVPIELELPDGTSRTIPAL